MFLITIIISLHKPNGSLVVTMISYSTVFISAFIPTGTIAWNDCSNPWNSISFLVSKRINLMIAS